MDHNFLENKNDFKEPLIVRKSKMENNLNKEITKVNKILYT